MDVQLYVYDLSRGMARSMSQSLLGTYIDAIYHTSIVYNGVEYFFGQGIQQSRPGATHHGNPMEVINLGQTQLPPEVVLEYLESMKSIYTPEAYDLFQNNCNNFSNDFAQFLVGRGIPDHITSLPKTVLDTPFGQMLKPQLDASMRPVTQAPVASQSAPPYMNAAPATNGSSHTQMSQSGAKEHGSVYNVVQASMLDKLLAEAKDGCSTIFFTSSTCAPCKLAYPTFDSLAAEHPKAIFIKIDLNEAHEIGARYQVRATPTFQTYLRGQKQETWSGADPGRLRSTVDMLVKQAFPGHPHASLTVPTLQSGSLRPISFPKIPPLDKVIAKMGRSATDPAVQSMKTFINARTASSKAADVPVPDLTPWATFLRSVPTTLAADSLFTAYDLLRCALLDPRVAAWFAAESGPSTPMTIRALTNHVAALVSASTCPYNLRLVALQLGCVLFASSPLMGKAVFASADLAATLAQLAASSLLAEPEKPALRGAAASLAFNLAAANYRVRREEGRELLGEAGQVEIVAALLECFGSDEGAGMKEGAHQALMVLGYLVYFAEEDGEVMDLCKAMGARETVGKLECEGKVRECKGDVVRVLPE